VPTFKDMFDCMMDVDEKWFFQIPDYRWKKLHPDISRAPTARGR
jgi:hypothetical protein